MGLILKAPAFLIYVVAGLWGLIICFGIVQDALGTVVAVIAFFLAPFLLTLAPWYSGFALGDWFPLMLIYGGGIGATILFAIGTAMEGDKE